LQVDGGRVGSVAPKAHPTGTTVEVRDLFFNVPARRKFLRAERTELGHIEEWAAFARPRAPDVELRVSHNGRPARRYRGDGMLASTDRLFETLGESSRSTPARRPRRRRACACTAGSRNRSTTARAPTSSTSTSTAAAYATATSRTR
jgi:DNA mismatch repair ATPase MutL